MKFVNQLMLAPVITMRQAESALGVTFAAAKNNVEKLVELGVLKEATGRERHRIYLAEEIFDAAFADLLPGAVVRSLARSVVACQRFGHGDACRRRFSWRRRMGGHLRRVRRHEWRQLQSVRFGRGPTVAFAPPPDGPLDWRNRRQQWVVTIRRPPRTPSASCSSTSSRFAERTFASSSAPSTPNQRWTNAD